MGNAPGSGSISGQVPPWGQQPAASGGSPASTDLVQFVDTYKGWAAANYYQAPAGELPGTSSFIAAVLVRNRFISTGSPNKEIFGTIDFTGSSGWSVGIQAGGPPQVQVYDGAAANIIAGVGAALYNPTTITRGRLELILLQWAGGNLSLWHNACLVETVAGTAGFTPGGSPQAYVAHEVTFTSTFNDGEIRGVAYYEGTATSDNIVDSFDQTMRNLRFTSGGAIPWDNLWTATGAPPATWSDEVAAMALTRNGTPIQGSCPALLL